VERATLRVAERGPTGSNAANDASPKRALQQQMSSQNGPSSSPALLFQSGEGKKLQDLDPQLQDKIRQATEETLADRRDWPGPRRRKQNHSSSDESTAQSSVLSVRSFEATGWTLEEAVTEGFGNDSTGEDCRGTTRCA